VLGCENRLKIRETGDKETKRQKDWRQRDGRGLTLEGMISILNGKDAETSSA
jgi:hypothetical protein